MMKRAAYYFAAAVLAVFVIMSGGCGKKSSDTASSANDTGAATIVAGGLTMTYTDGDGIPNVKATPTLTPTSGTSTDTISISVPVDTDVTGITFNIKHIDPNASDEVQRTAAAHTVKGTIATGIATATLELFPGTAVGYYGVEIGAEYSPNSGNTVRYVYSLNQFYGTKTTYNFGLPASNEPADTKVAYPTFQVTATSTIGSTAADPVPVAKDVKKKSLVKSNSVVTYLKVANSVQGKLYSIRMPDETSSSVYLTTANSAANGIIRGNTVVEEDTGSGVPFNLKNTSATEYRVVSLMVRENSAGTKDAPVVLASKKPVTGVAKGTIPTFYSAPVTSGGWYNVELWSLAPNTSAGTKLSCYNGDALYSSATLTPTSTEATTPGLGCMLTAESDTAYFTVEGNSQAGTAYYLLVQPTAASFGTSTASVALTSGPTTTSSSAGYQASSYYSFSGAPASGKATFSNLSAPIFVYFSSGAGNGFNCNLDPIDSSSLTCPYTVTAAGTVEVVVSGSSIAGAYYDMKLE